MAVTPELTEQPVTPPAPPREARRPSAFGALLLRLHFYAGVLVAPFLVVAALTGLLYTATPQIDTILYGDKLTAATTTGPTLPLAEQIAAARASHPDGTIAAVQPAEDDQSTRVVFSQPDLGENQHTVYVDPHTGKVQGQLTTWWGSTPMTTWLDDLHRNLHLGDLGRHYSEIAASWLWVLTLGGIVLWWRRRRSVRKMLAPELSAKKGVRRTRGWHAATGLWLSLGLLILSATGLTWSRYAGASFDTVQTAFDAQRPGLEVPGVSASAGGHHGAGSEAPVAVDPAQADTVLKVARDSGLTGPVELSLPETGGAAWTVAGIDNTWPVQLDRIAVDPATSTVVARSDFADWPLLAQLSKLGVQAHMGILFGPVNQILLAALAIGLLCVILWGYRMWWQRRPTRADRPALVGSAPARGAWLGLPAWAIVAGVPVVFAIGWALPWFGIPLAAFLLADALLSLRERA
ncbi:membrane protein [Actinoplanes lobatus]|uniref:Membrane protein n=1 Tax=Actinoplanes lobatus TaxID=113568 RepID=A0A7W7HFW9_9ACTN|nr:PepSY domain-containing protein [Actinoplanes lobatus]MBB4749744.1 putative iron-regulated membrane protein [Actinoplanes lobatus]GGN76048.1 membrane protein [Actinoplanes lobatus]GIE38482.1 membrane protein [Actinoplanes lobatus]